MLVVGPRHCCGRPSKFIAEHDVMGAISAVAGTVVVVEMLVHADQPGIVEARGVIGLLLDEPSERLGQPLVLQNHAAGNEIAALGRLVLMTVCEKISPSLSYLQTA